MCKTKKISNKKVKKQAQNKLDVKLKLYYKNIIEKNARTFWNAESSLASKILTKPIKPNVRII